MPSGRLISFALIALSMVTAPLALAQPAPAGPPLGTTRVAIASPSRIFNEMQETKALRKGLETKGKELMQKDAQMRETIKGMIDRRGQFKPGSEQRRAISDQIDQLQANLQSWSLATKAALERDQKEMLLNLYDKIEVAVGEVAQKNGIALVVVDGRQEMPNLEDAPAAEVSRMINARNVLFASKGVDITEQVIILLDAKFAQNGSAPPPPR